MPAVPHIEEGDFVNAGRDKVNLAIDALPLTYDFNPATGVLTITRQGGIKNEINLSSAFGTIAQIADAILPGLANFERAGLIKLAEDGNPLHETEDRVYTAAAIMRLLEPLLLPILQDVKAGQILRFRAKADGTGFELYNDDEKNGIDTAGLFKIGIGSKHGEWARDIPGRILTRKIGTLPATAGGTLDKAHIQLLGGGWGSQQTALYSCTFGNRGGFTYKWTAEGDPAESSGVDIAAYAQANGTVDIYLQVSREFATYDIWCWGKTLALDENLTEVAPTGTRIFTTADPGQFKPEYRLNNGFSSGLPMTITSNVTVKSLFITNPAIAKALQNVFVWNSTSRELETATILDLAKALAPHISTILGVGTVPPPTPTVGTPPPAIPVGTPLAMGYKWEPALGRRVTAGVNLAGTIRVKLELVTGNSPWTDTNFYNVEGATTPINGINYPQRYVWLGVPDGYYRVTASNGTEQTVGHMNLDSVGEEATFRFEAPPAEIPLPTPPAPTVGTPPPTVGTPPSVGTPPPTYTMPTIGYTWDSNNESFNSLPYIGDNSTIRTRLIPLDGQDWYADSPWFITTHQTLTTNGYTSDRRYIFLPEYAGGKNVKPGRWLVVAEDVNNPLRTVSAIATLSKTVGNSGGLLTPNTPAPPSVGTPPPTVGTPPSVGTPPPPVAVPQLIRVEGKVDYSGGDYRDVAFRAETVNFPSGLVPELGIYYYNPVSSPNPSIFWDAFEVSASGSFTHAASNTSQISNNAGAYVRYYVRVVGVVAETLLFQDDITLPTVIPWIQRYPNVSFIAQAEIVQDVNTDSADLWIIKTDVNKTLVYTIERTNGTGVYANGYGGISFTGGTTFMPFAADTSRPPYTHRGRIYKGSGQVSGHDVTGIPENNEYRIRVKEFNTDGPEQATVKTIVGGTNTLGFTNVAPAPPVITPPAPAPASEDLIDFPAFPSMSLPADEVFLDNGVVKIGFKRAFGGSFWWLGDSGSSENLVNNPNRGEAVDKTGRQWQTSIYMYPENYTVPGATAHSQYTNFKYNGLEGGSAYGSASEWITYSRKDVFINGAVRDVLYLKVRGDQWKFNNVASDIYFEKWVWQEGKTTRVQQRVVIDRQDGYTGPLVPTPQELPCLYLRGDFITGKTYSGQSPWTNQALTTYNFPAAEAKTMVTYTSELAILRNATRCVGMLVRDYASVIFQYFDDPADGPFDNDSVPSGYMAAYAHAIWQMQDTKTWAYSVILGANETEVRSLASAQPRPAKLPNSVFGTGNNQLQDWITYFCNHKSVNSDGWRVTNFDGGGRNPDGTNLMGPLAQFAASGAPKIYVRAKGTGVSALRIYFAKAGQSQGIVSAPIGTSQYVEVPFTNDSTFRSYEINMASHSEWSGLIMRIWVRFVGDADQDITLKAVSHVNEYVGPPTPTPSPGGGKALKIGKLGLRAKPQPTDASGAGGQHLQWGQTAYSDQAAWLEDCFNKFTANGTRHTDEVTNFIMNYWDSWERNGNGSFNVGQETQFLNIVDWHRTKGATMIVGPSCYFNNGYGGSTPTARRNLWGDEDCILYSDGSIATGGLSQAMFNFELIYDALTDQPGLITDTSKPVGKLVRWYDKLFGLCVDGYNDDVIVGVTLALNPLDESGYPREAPDYKVAGFGEKVRSKWNGYYSFLPAGTGLPTPGSDVRNVFDSQKGRLFMQWRSRMVAYAMGLKADRALRVMPDLKLIIDQGQIEGNEAGITAEVDTQEVIRILIDEVLRPRFPNTAFKVVIKLNPFPNDDHTFAGAFLAGLTLTDQNTNVECIMDVDFINGTGGKIYGNTAADLAAKMEQANKTAGGQLYWGLHGFDGDNAWPIVKEVSRIYGEKTFPPSGVLTGPPVGFIVHSPERHAASPQGYRNNWVVAQFNANGQGNRQRVRRAARIRRVEKRLVDGQKQLRITMDYPVATAFGKVAYFNGSAWIDTAAVSSAYVAIHAIPSNMSSVKLRPNDNIVAELQIDLSGLTGDWQVVDYLDKIYTPG